MDWNKQMKEKFNMYAEIKNKESKQIVANKIADKVKEGDVIGFGSGSTSFLAVCEIAKKIEKEKIKIIAIPTSYEIKMLCSYYNIQTASLLEKRPDWCFDGADEVDKNNWLIKGRGAAMFQEKLNIINSPKTYILVDETKFVSKLGEKCPVPVECFPNSINFVKERLLEFGANEIILRKAVSKDGPVITENGNFILDVKFENISEDLEKKLKLITGVLETGLFIGYNIEIVN